MYYFHIDGKNLLTKTFVGIENNTIISRYDVSILDKDFKNELKHLGIKKYRIYNYSFGMIRYIIEDKFPRHINSEDDICSSLISQYYQKGLYFSANLIAKDGLYFSDNVVEKNILIAFFGKSSATKFTLSKYYSKQFDCDSWT